MKEQWVLDIQSNCVEAGVPFFFKQWGGVNKKAAGRVLHGRTYDEMPRVREAVPSGALELRILG
jgi:protein gp37